METRSQILAILRKVTGKDTSPAPDESLFDSGLLDSFGLETLVSELEKAFGLKVPDSDLIPRKFDSIERIEQYIDEHGN